MSEKETIEAALDAHGRDPNKLIPILQAAQKELKYLSEGAMRAVAAGLGIPEARVFGVASFYSHFALSAKGRHVIRLCDGTACHVRGSESVRTALEEAMGLSRGETTTKDMMFSLEIVSCLGMCGLAPVMVADEEIYGETTPEKAKGIIEKIKAEEGGKQ